MNMIISDQGMKILNKIKGKKIISICADDWQASNRSYGNIKIDLENYALEIENNYREVLYFGTKEELAGYNIVSLKGKKFTPSVMYEDLCKKYINKKIIRVNLVRDSIEINYININKKEVYEIDQAIIFDFGEMKLGISQTSIFTPVSKIMLSINGDLWVKSIEEVENEWADDDLETSKESLKYEVKIERKIIEL